MLTFLKNPSLYQWIKLEAREAGKLDDVVVLRVDDTVEATQVKFSTDVLRPGDPLTWKNLLRRGNQGMSPSLIEQWWDSVVALDQEYGRTEPRLFSNRKAGDDLFLTATGRIDVDKTSSDVLERIKSLLGDVADDFIERFCFEVNEQGLTDLQERLQREFQSLGLPETNWLGFMDAIRSWIRCENLPAERRALALEPTPRVRMDSTVATEPRSGGSGGLRPRGHRLSSRFTSAGYGRQRARHHLDGGTRHWKKYVSQLSG